MELILTLVALIVAYLLGAIPFAYLLGMKVKGIDIRRHGSGNVGATNGVRVLGAKLGLSAGALDIIKAVIPILLAQFFAANWLNGTFPIDYLWVGVAAAVGHCYPVYMKFQGGKAVATSIGAYLTLFPLSTLVIFLLSLGVVKVTKFVSLASSLFSVMFVLEGVLFMRTLEEQLPRIALMALILWRHRSNYQRILRGTENKAKL